MINKKLQYFVGKVCSIFTTETNRDFAKENPNTFLKVVYNYFMGVVESIDDDGIWINQIPLENGAKSFFSWKFIVSIAEEPVLNPNDPKNAEIIEQFKALKEDTKKNLAVKPPEVNANPYFNPDELSDLINQNHHV